MAGLTHGACYAAFYGGGPPVQVPFLARLVPSLDLDGEFRVLDLGCGTGRSSNRWPRSRVAGGRDGSAAR